MNSLYRPPADNGLDIRYLDAHLIVLNKPSGLLSVPGRGEDKQDSLALRVQREFPAARVVHRLDMSTSGLMLMALDAQAQAAMGRLFEQRAVDKRYLAVVAGLPQPQQGEVDLPLITDWPNRPRQKVDQVQGKPSRTRYQVLGYEQASDTAQVQLVPLTGRSHQLRVHMMALGHPILGDELYADTRWRDAAGRLLLHAERLGFLHPVTGEQVHIACPAEFR